MACEYDEVGDGKCDGRSQIDVGVTIIKVISYTAICGCAKYS